MMSAMDIFKLRRARHTKWVEQYLIDQRLKPLEPPEIAVLRKDREVPLPHLKILRSDIILFLCVADLIFCLDLLWPIQSFFTYFALNPRQWAWKRA